MKKKLLAGLVVILLLAGACGSSSAFKDGMQDAIDNTQAQSIIVPETESELANTLAKSDLKTLEDLTESTQSSNARSTEVTSEAKTSTEYAFEQKTSESTETVAETKLSTNSTAQSTNTATTQQGTQPETQQQISEVPQSSAPAQNSNQTQSDGIGQESAPSTASSTQPTEEMVWIPATGSKYHRNSSCSNMKNPSQVSKDEAISRGYEPCKKCY